MGLLPLKNQRTRHQHPSPGLCVASILAGSVLVTLGVSKIGRLLSDEPMSIRASDLVGRWNYDLGHEAVYAGCLVEPSQILRSLHSKLSEDPGREPVDAVAPSRPTSEQAESGNSADQVWHGETAVDRALSEHGLDSVQRSQSLEEDISRTGDSSLCQEVVDVFGDRHLVPNVQVVASPGTVRLKEDLQATVVAS